MTSSNEYIPYVYIVVNKTTKLKYIGVRYARNCHPSNLWVTYFTSSKLVKHLIEIYGVEDFKRRILHTYPNDPTSAIKKEAEYFELIKKRDNFLNQTYSSGIIDLNVASKAGKIGGLIVYNRKIGIFRSEEDRRIWATNAGKVGGAVQRDKKLGIHGLSAEQRKINSSKAGKVGGFTNPELQRELGRRGGPKNKGFKWLTNGSTNIKYTVKMQLVKSVDDFLKENPDFRKGMTPWSKLK